MDKDKIAEAFLKAQRDDVSFTCEHGTLSHAEIAQHILGQIIPPELPLKNGNKGK